MKNCEHYQKLLSDYHDDNREYSDDLNRHVKECRDCQSFAETIKNNSALISDLTIQSMPNRSKAYEEKGIISSIKSIYKRRISIPVPVAAVIAIIMFGWIVTDTFVDEPVQKNKPSHEIKYYEKIEFVKFIPVSAVELKNN